MAILTASEWIGLGAPAVLARIFADPPTWTVGKLMGAGIPGLAAKELLNVFRTSKSLSGAGLPGAWVKNLVTEVVIPSEP